MRLGILCGGGPAPGMNSVISAATIEARNSGWDVRGVMDGFQHLIEGRIEGARPLSITDVSRIEYTRDLGYGAVDYLKRVLAGGEPGGMVTIQEGHMVPLPFGSFTDPGTGRVRIRLVNVESSSYRVAREYMIRLDRQDLDDPEQAPPDRSGLRAHALGLPRPVRLSRRGLSPMSGQPSAPRRSVTCPAGPSRGGCPAR